MTDPRDLEPHDRWRADLPPRREEPPAPAPTIPAGAAPLEGHAPPAPTDPDEARRAWVRELVDRSEP